MPNVIADREHLLYPVCEKEKKPGCLFAVNRAKYAQVESLKTRGIPPPSHDGVWLYLEEDLSSQQANYAY